MPSLTDKLKELGVQVGTTGIQFSRQTEIPHDLIDHLPGAWETTSRGECFVVRKSFPLSERVGPVISTSRPSLSVFEPLPSLEGISDIPLSQILFIDTETTGLSGGAGTYVFLVGAARISEDQIEFAQFFLQDPASEASQLAALESFSANTRALVSYNGKSFDLPRIKNRYLFHGWPAPFENVYHIDLLHIARRLWKDHLPGCTLGDLEYHLLHMERDGLDIPGWQVSEKFFEYLQNRDPEPLKGVFYHNEVDVISLVTLLGYISDRLACPTHPAYLEREDQLSFGKFLAYLRQEDSAAEVLESYLKNRKIPSHHKISAQTALASIHKNKGEYKRAVKLWKKSAKKGEIRPSIELAMYYEHQRQDYEEAIHWTLTALDASRDREPESTNLELEIAHRLNRLKKKAGNLSDKN